MEIPKPAGVGRVRYQVLAAACAGALIAYIHRSGFSAILPYLAKDLGLGADQSGYLMTAFLLGYGIFQVPGGRLGDLFGGRLLLTTAAYGWSLATVLVTLAAWLAPSGTLAVFVYLALWRFLFGAFQAVLFPALSRVMADWMIVPERATAQGLIWMASRTGGAIAPILLVDLTVHFTPEGSFYKDWKTPLLVVALPGFVWALFFWRWFRNRPEEMPQVGAAERTFISGGRAPVVGHKRIPWRALSSSVSVWALCLMYGFGGFSASFFITLLPTYLKTTRGLTDDEMKWLSSLPLACGVAGCLLGGLLSDWIIRRTGNRKWGRRINGSIGPVIAGMALTATNWVTAEQIANDRSIAVAALAGLLCLTFFFNDLAMGPSWAACADIGDRHAGIVAGAMNTTGNIFAAICTTIGGLLIKYKQTELLFFIFGGSFCIAAVCWLFVDVTKPLQLEDDPS